MIHKPVILRRLVSIVSAMASSISIDLNNSHIHSLGCLE